MEKCNGKCGKKLVFIDEYLDKKGRLCKSLEEENGINKNKIGIGKGGGQKCSTTMMISGIFCSLCFLSARSWIFRSIMIGNCFC